MKKKGVWIVIILALVVIVGGGGFLIGSLSKHSDSNNQGTAGKKSASAVTTGAVSVKQGILVQCQKKNSWEENGKTNTQIDVILKNVSSTSASDWEFSMDVPSGTKIKQLWNAKFKISGSSLTATAADFNKEIPAKGQITFGLILSAGQEIEPKGAKVLVNGEEFKDDSQQEETEQPKMEAVVEAPGQTPVGIHGKLSVKGTNLVDKDGKKYQLRGISTHGLAWFPEYVNKQAFQSLRDLFGINVIRLAMYSDPGAGYTPQMHKKVREGVKYASELGMYVIIDWHILSDGNPNKNKANAKKFFQEMSKAYSSYDNVIYEICNEPNGDVKWDRDIKPYANEIIPIIRKNAKDAVVIVGTPTWSQDVDIAAQSPLKQKNVMYALHFYASTHKDNIRDKAKKAIQAGLPLFISEFSICEASGNGTINYGEASKWVDLMKKNNLSYAMWSLSNKNEVSSLLKPDCKKKSGWAKDDLSETGKWLYNLQK